MTIWKTTPSNARSVRARTAAPTAAGPPYASMPHGGGAMKRTRTGAAAVCEEPAGEEAATWAAGSTVTVGTVGAW